MNTEANSRLRRSRLTAPKAAALVVVALALILTVTAFAATKLSIAGFLDFGYPDTVREPTEGRPEHKLWYHDGMWWASMYSTSASAFTIHRLDWSSQTWEDTEVVIDEREETRSDTLWDGSKLFVTTYIKQENPGFTSNVDNQARIQRYSYDNSTDTWVMDAGFPRLGIVDARLKVLSLEKDSTGRLWIAYITRPSGTTNYQVYVRSSSDSGVNWTAPLPLINIFPDEALTAVTQTQGVSDVVGLIAFTDNSGPKLGVMWSNERTGVNKFFFAVHPDASAPDAGWTMDEVIDQPANDHVNLAKTSDGKVFAAIKTSTTTPGGALNAVLTRDRSGNFTFHPINPLESNDTKPIVVVYEPNSGPDKAYVFMSSNPTGGVVCVIEAEITSNVADMNFPVGNCGSPSISAPRIVLGDASTYTLINDPTSTRQILNENTDIVLLANDQANNVYVHAVVLSEFPAVTTRTPAPGAVLQTTNVTVRVTFDTAMDASTINSSSFRLTRGSSAVDGTVAYNSSTRIATFTPADDLVPGSQYTVTLANTITSEAGETLLDTPMTWTFTVAGGATDALYLYLPVIVK